MAVISNFTSENFLFQAVDQPLNILLFPEIFALFVFQFVDFVAGFEIGLLHAAQSAASFGFFLGVSRGQFFVMR